MKVRSFRTGALAGALCLGIAVPFAAFADEEKKAEEKKADEAKPAAAAPDQEAMMKAWMEVATPGDAHKKLEPLAGSFTAKVKSWMAPGAKAEETEGNTETKWALGNRFIEQRHEGSMMGQPFLGIGFTGYDNYKKRYVASWIDNMGTAMLTMTGTVDKTGKVFTFRGTMDDVMQKKPVALKSTVKIVDDDHNTYEMWGPDPAGKMFKMLEIEYSRKK